MNNINVEISFEEMLIDQVQKYKILYDKSASGYKNSLTKSVIWKKIAEQTSHTGIYYLIMKIIS